MLVLTRKTGQRIFIGHNVVVTVGKVFEDGRVRLCVEAPREVNVVREELVTKEGQKCSASEQSSSS